MPNLVQIQEKTNEYSENLLPANSTFKQDNPFVNYTGNGFTDFVSNYSISSFTNSFFLDTIQDPILGMQESFDFGSSLSYQCQKTGSYTFSFNLLSWNYNAPDTYSITLYLDVYKNNVNTESFPIEIVKGTIRNFEFYTFYQSFILISGETVNFKFRTESVSIGAPNPSIKWNFSGFKLEINDKIVSGQGLPTPYTLPVSYIQSVKGEIEVWDLYGDSETPRAYTGGTTGFKFPNDAIYNNYKGITGLFNSGTNQLDLSPMIVGNNIEITLDCKVETTVANQTCYFEFFASIGDANAWDANLSNELTFKSTGVHRIIIHVKYPIEFASDLANPAEIRFFSPDNATLYPRFLHIVTKKPAE